MLAFAAIAIWALVKLAGRQLGLNFEAERVAEASTPLNADLVVQRRKMRTGDPFDATEIVRRHFPSQISDGLRNALERQNGMTCEQSNAGRNYCAQKFLNWGG